MSMEVSTIKSGSRKDDLAGHTREEKINSLVSEFVAHGGAFVEDDWHTDMEGDETYNPFVDRENAESWIRDVLEAVIE